MFLAGMTEENRFESASTDSHPAPETGNIRERVQKLRQDVNQLSETLEAINRNAQEAAGKKSQ
jgi:histidinol phosphatase-like PHP family hydrolase